MKEKNKCRWCGLELTNHPSHPKTGEDAIWHKYGGFACSKRCSELATKDVESTMPGHSNGM